MLKSSVNIYAEVGACADGTFLLKDQYGNTIEVDSNSVASGQVNKLITAIVDRSFARQVGFYPGTQTFPFHDDVLSIVQVGTIIGFDLVNCSAAVIQYDGIGQTFSVGSGDYDYDFDNPITTALLGQLSIMELTITDSEAPAFITFYGYHE